MGDITAREMRDPDYIKPLPKPIHLEVWVPGNPKQKNQGFARVSKRGNPYMTTDKKTIQAEANIRQVFIDTMCRDYPHLIPYLPIRKGAARLRTIFLMSPPEKAWFQGKQHTKRPDWSNLYKLVEDALAGRQARMPPLLYVDDCLVEGGSGLKVYWDPHMIHVPGYPQQPGTQIFIDLYPEVRDPRLPPAGLRQCKRCGRDDFKTDGGLRRHEQYCKDGRKKVE